MVRRVVAVSTLSLLFLLPACSIRKMAMNQVADTLTAPGGGAVFTGDNDPELVGDALPFAIKLYESLMVSIPWHDGLKRQTGSMYVMYANAFLQAPASMLSKDEYQQQEFGYRRAKNLYLRGRDIVLAGLEHRYPGFRRQLDARQYDRALAGVRKSDVPDLYWAAAGWLGAYAIDPLDMDIGLNIPAAAAMMARANELDPRFNDGAIQDFYVLYYGSLPEYMGGSAAKAREHFARSQVISQGRLASPFLSLATTVSVKEQNLAEFRELLEKVVAMDPDREPANRLVQTLNIRKARWLLDHADDLFIGDETESETPVVPKEKE